MPVPLAFAPAPLVCCNPNCLISSVLSHAVEKEGERAIDLGIYVHCQRVIQVVRVVSKSPLILDIH